MLAGRHHSRQVVQTIATLAVFAACVISLDAFFRGLPPLVGQGGIAELAYTWFSAGDVHVELALRMDALSGLLCLVVTFIGTLIHVYSAGYMAHDAGLRALLRLPQPVLRRDAGPGPGRQPAGDVHRLGRRRAGSYLLIGFWYKDAANASAGKKAFITNRIGDFGFLIGHRSCSSAPPAPSTCRRSSAPRSRAGGLAPRFGSASRSRSGPGCSSSWARRASRRRSRSTSGCPTRWPAPRRSPR